MPRSLPSPKRPEIVAVLTQIEPLPPEPGLRHGRGACGEVRAPPHPVSYEVRSAGVSVDAALVAFVRIAAEPIVIAVSGAHIGLERGMEPIQRPALHSRGPSLRGRRRGGMRYVAPVAMMTGRGALGCPGRGRGEEGARRDQQTSNAPHKALLRPRHKIQSADRSCRSKVQDLQPKVSALSISAGRCPDCSLFMIRDTAALIWRFGNF